MQNQLIHLARKWRSTNFDGIVGQDLSVRILKNSLFTGKLFPVYLFAGQHGCGKTTTARVFAAAVNCEKLSIFQQDPKGQVIPCLDCASCQAMAAGKHPDFHEIDAASHTGVDNARQIVEAASMVPLMGRRKIYLIDEAHMLSKAAFNALLKMLEEPPASALFMLATTDDQKILETVKSRSFQLFFHAVPDEALHAHLTHVCTVEAIPFEPEALSMVIKETGGSVRDALNLVEQVYLSAQRVGLDELVSVLGYLPADQLLCIFERVLNAADAKDVLSCVQQVKLEQYNAEYVWMQWIRLMHAAVWLVHDVPPPDCPVAIPHLRALLTRAVATRMVSLCTLCYEHETLFVKTAHKALLLPIVIMRCWQHMHEGVAREVNNTITEGSRVAATPIIQCSPAPMATAVQPASGDASWQAWLNKLEATGDSLLISIFKQGVLDGVDSVLRVVSVRFAQRLSLFNDTVQQRVAVWEPLIREIFGDAYRLELKFVKDDIGIGAQTPPPAAKPVAAPPVLSAGASSRVQGERIDVSNKQEWPVTHALLQQFSGVVVKTPSVAASNGEVHE